jgi:hypothetical protein
LANETASAFWQNETKIACDFSSGLLRERQLARLSAALSHHATLPNPPFAAACNHGSYRARQFPIIMRPTK